MPLMNLLKSPLLAAAVLLPLQLPAGAADDFLAPELAFRFSARMVDAKTIAATWSIADGYYMYREQFAFKADGARLGNIGIARGKIKFDETFNKDVETYRHKVTVHIPVEASGPFVLAVRSQGCADKGLCYAPQNATVRLSPNGEIAPGNPFKSIPGKSAH